jgi:hypothetical protein
MIETLHRTHLPEIRFPMIAALIARLETVQISGIIAPLIVRDRYWYMQSL